jgi:type II secretory pathway component PulC
LQAGDIILRVQQQRVSTPEQAQAALQARAEARQPFAAVLVQRDDKRTWIPVALPGD